MSQEKIWNNAVLKQLIRLALPVIATSFMSMAYNFINIIFVGRLGSDAVAAVGSAGFFMNLSWGLSSLFTVGAGIKVSHAKGKNNALLAKGYVRSGVQTILIVALIYVLILAFTSDYLIGILDLRNPEIEHSASTYLLIAGLSIPFFYQNLFYTSVFVGYGDSRSPFMINTTAFLLNMALDPILIFLAGWGIYGAAIATILSQGVATILFYKKLRTTDDLRPSGIIFRKILLKNIVGLGISPTIQRVSFTIIAIAMARIISNWGATAIAVQKAGIQIEAISFMTVGGIMSALSSISGKAHGAKNYLEQWKAYQAGLLLAFSIGIITSVLFISFPKTLFSIFLSDTKSLEMGSEYLVILGYSQLFMCLELMTTGAFFGWGKTNIPAITGISLTLLRIPMALLFIHLWKYSLSSVWWSISISSIAKGILLVTIYIILFRSVVKKYKPEYETSLLLSRSK